VKVYVQGGDSHGVSLGQREFMAQGGQGAVYVRGDVVYKIYHDPKDMIPTGKVRELSEMTDSRIVRPQQILVDKTGAPVGYTTRLVRDAHVLCQIFPKSFRTREGVTAEAVQALVRKFQEGIQHVHSRGILVVDMNEMNFLVGRGFDTIFFIDVDGYQTPHYPAPALMESIRDWSVQAQRWSTLSDWFSFAVLTFQMFIGLHPFRGRYDGGEEGYRSHLPADRPDDAFAVTRRRMQNSISVFHPHVKYPQTAAYPLTVIPAAYKAWYEAVFQQGKRCPPPSDFGAAVIVLPVVSAMRGTTLLDIQEIGRFEGTITQVWSHGSNLVVATDQGIWLNQQRVISASRPAAVCGFTPRCNRAVVVERAAEEGHPPISSKVRWVNLTDQGPQRDLDLSTRETSAYDGRVYARLDDKVYEIVLTDTAADVLPSTRPIANVLPHATRLYPGVIFQSLLGASYVSLLIRPGVAQQIRVPELDPCRVLDMRFDHGVLMAMAMRRGQYLRLVLRFNADGAYDVREVPNASLAGLNFTTLDSGVCICLNEEEKLEICSARPGSTGLKIVEDKTLCSDMLLAQHNGCLVAARGGTLYSMRMKP